MTTAYLLCFSVTVVAANPVFQRIPIQLTQTCQSQTCPTQTVLSQPCPTQTCLPQISPSQACQTCLPKTCSTCQTAFPTLPNQIRQTPCQSCQNNQRNFLPLSLVAHQANCPCNQPVQNNNQQANQEVLNQIMLSKILGPQLQMMLNPNAKACDHCASKPKTDPVPNIINNYIIIPPEYFKSNETIKNKEDTRVRERKGRRRNQKPMVDDDDFELDDNDKLFGYVKNFGEMNNRARNDIWSEKQGRQRNEEYDVENNPIEKSGIPKTSAASIFKFVNDDKSRLLLDKIAKFLGNTVSPHIADNNQDVLSEKISYIGNKPVEATQKRKNPVKVRTFEETIIKDFCKKNPDIPEEIAWSLLMNLKRQAQHPKNSHQYPTFPFGYQYRPQMYNPNNQAPGRTESDRRQKDRRQRRPKINRSGQKNKNREKQGNKEPCDTCDETAEINPTVVNVETEMFTTDKISTTTEKKVQDTVPKKNSETQMETPNNLIDELEKIKDKFVKLNEIETTTMNYNKLLETFPELGQEDKVPTVYDNGVDYYPDFRSDNIELERYHYTTDRNGVGEGRKHEQRYVGLKKHSHDQISAINDNYKIDDISTEYPLPTSIEESNESSEESINESVEIQFRTPPSLELPDFETKQINKYYASEEIDDKFVTDKNKASAYSDVKRTQENDLRPVKVFSKDKQGKTSVETLFGHSKVVKYGQDVEAAGSSPVITYYLPEEAITEERIQLPDGDRAVVVAKSIRNLKEIWK